MTILPNIAFSLILFACALGTSGIACAATPYAQGDMDALIQIDKDMDGDDKLNWYNPADGSNPGDGGDWYSVTWENGRVVAIGKRNTWPKREAPHWLTGSSEGFRALTALRELWLDLPIGGSRGKRPGFTDIGSLAALEKLEVLEIIGTHLADLRSVSGLRNLKMLSVTSERPRATPLDITHLRNLTNLEKLDLLSCEITDISSLATLTRLRNLRLDLNRVTNVEALANLKALRTLSLGGNAIEDITPLTGLASLADLRLGGNNIRDIPSLAGLANLYELHLSSNRIHKAAGLLTAPPLMQFFLDNNHMPPSQLHLLMQRRRVEVSAQREVEIDTLLPPLTVGVAYDISSEYFVGDTVTTVSAARLDANFFHRQDQIDIANANSFPERFWYEKKFIASGEDFSVNDNGSIVFKKPGYYALRFTNTSVYSRGLRLRVDPHSGKYVSDDAKNKPTKVFTKFLLVK